MLRLGLSVVLLVVGVACGTASVILHPMTWALALAALASLATLVAAPPGWPRCAYAVGWVGVLGYVLNPRPEGDYLVSSDANGWVLLGLGVVLLVAAVGTLPRRRWAHERGEPGTTP